MKEATLNRIGIVASIVGAVATLAYLLRKPGGAAAVIAGGSPGPAGAPGIGLPGPAGPPGAASTAPGGEGVPGAPAATSGSGTPPPGSLYQFFLGSFAPQPGRYTSISSNLGPGADLGKSAAARPQPGTSQNGSCGCSGAAGCNGKPGRCANTPASYAYPDGAGACVSTTHGRLVRAMDRCKPGWLDSEVDHLVGATQYVPPGSEPNIGWYTDYLYSASRVIPGTVPDAKDEQWPNWVPSSRFGAA